MALPTSPLTITDRRGVRNVYLSQIWEEGKETKQGSAKQHVAMPVQTSQEPPKYPTQNCSIGLDIFGLNTTLKSIRTIVSCLCSFVLTFYFINFFFCFGGIMKLWFYFLHLLVLLLSFFCFAETVSFNIFKSWWLCIWGTFVFVYLSVVKLSGNELRDSDSPTPPLSIHNHAINNLDYNKEGLKDKNSLHDENPLKAEGAR